jgi:hypothetical protein
LRYLTETTSPTLTRAIIIHVPLVFVLFSYSKHSPKGKKENPPLLEKPTNEARPGARV